MSLQRYYDARNLYLLLRKHQASHPGGRRAFASWSEYLKYVYYRFSIEREQGQEKAADAVLIGLCDALAGRFGPQGPPPRAALAVLRQVFRIWPYPARRPAGETRSAPCGSCSSSIGWRGRAPAVTTFIPTT